MQDATATLAHTKETRRAPSPHLSQAAYFRAFDKVCEAPLTDTEAARLAELRTLARNGLKGDDRGEYMLLCQVEAAQKQRARWAAREARND